jgi:uncharacterized protein
VAWQPESEPAPSAALDSRDGVVHLAGEPIDQRWTAAAKERIRSSREVVTPRPPCVRFSLEPGPAPAPARPQGRRR